MPLHPLHGTIDFLFMSAEYWELVENIGYSLAGAVIGIGGTVAYAKAQGYNLRRPQWLRSRSERPKEKIR